MAYKTTEEMLVEFVEKHKPRADWHEPDEQDIVAWVLGNHLDNAMGNMIVPELIERGNHELLVILSCGSDTVTLNLANILALATNMAIAKKVANTINKKYTK